MNLDKTRNISEERQWGITQILGEIAQEVPPNSAKMYLTGVRIQRALSATYPVRISTIFETTNKGESVCWW